VAQCAASRARPRDSGYQSNFASGTFFVYHAGLYQQLVGELPAGQAGHIHSGRGDFTRELRGWELGSYAQDEYRISSTLTLNYGVRYEITTPFRDIHNRMMSLRRATNPLFTLTLQPAFCFPATPVCPDTIAPIFKNDWAPRIGFAWNPLGNSARTVIRSAYGIFYDELLNGVGMPFAPPAAHWGKTVVRTLTGFAKINYANPLATVTNRLLPAVCATRVYLHHR